MESTAMFKLLRSAAIGLLGLLIVGCGPSTPEVLPTLIPTEIPPTVAPTSTRPPVEQTTFQIMNQQPATLRIVNAIPDSPALTIYAGFRAIATNFSFKQFTEPTPIDAGEYTVKITLSGSQPEDAPLLEKQIAFEPADMLVLVVGGQTNNPSLTAFPQELAAQRFGETVITAINASADGSPVAIKKEENEIISPVGSGRATTSAPVQTGSASLSVQLGNISTDLSLELEDQQAYTLVIAGSSDTDASVIYFSTPTPSLVEVRTVHATQGFGSVNVYVNDKLLNDNVAFGADVPWQTLPNGNYTVSVFPVGSDPESTQPLLNQNMIFDGATGISLILVGTENDLRLLFYPEDLTPTAHGETRLAFLNTLVDIPRINLLTGSGSLRDIQNVTYGEMPRSTTLVSQTISFQMSGSNLVDRNRPGTVELSGDLQLQAGTSYLYLITGQTDNKPVILSREVGVRDELASTESAIQSSARVRFINATTSAIDFSINHSPMISALPYAQASEFTSVTTLSASLSVSSNGVALTEPLDITFEENTRYTIVAYTVGAETTRLLVIPDTGVILNSSTPHLRLINVSPEMGTGFSLAYSESTTETESEATPAPAPEAPDLRRSIPFGVFRIMSNVGSGDASNAILMPAGRFDISIIDTELLQIGATISGVPLNGNTHYDIVAYQEVGTARIRAFAVPYPM
jgi:hypothetical protein